MSTPIIQIERLGKKYRLHHETEGGHRYKALRDVIANSARGLFRRFSSRPETRADGRNEDFWALQDVSLAIAPGEIVGIIGRNGAGKSTLLKVLSRITEPTAGRVRIRGRVASLLEVGTGFHPELTGRENIYLNGAILGMTRAEIRRKFDEIVAFAEVERFLDTPVKRFSSGMYVRLAFAVAAHLEPEILIVDEVLAVGDAEFQKRCLGKLGEVRGQGRTILFVSHNMAAVKSLTTRGIVFNSGRVVFDGPTDAAIQHYARLPSASGEAARRSWGRGKHTAIRDVRMLDSEGRPTAQYFPGEPLRLEIEFETDGTPGMSLDIFLLDGARSRLGMASTCIFHGQTLPTKQGTWICRMDLQSIWLASGTYFLEMKTAVVYVTYDHSVETALEFDVPFSNPLGHPIDFRQATGFGAIALLSDPPARFLPLDSSAAFDPSPLRNEEHAAKYDG